MKKSAIILIITSLILSGCIDKDENFKNNITSSIIENGTIGDLKNSSVENRTMSSSASNNISNINARDDNKEENGCIPGNKITVRGEEFTIVGSVSYEGRDVCKAEIVRDNGKTTRYYSNDGTFESMVSTSSGKNASSSAVSIVNVGKN